MKRVQLLPNLLTAFSLALGLFVIFRMTVADASDPDFLQSLQKCVYLLVVAALADFLDGAVARLINAESDFGGQFDSLADAISFGVAPAVLLLKSLQMPEQSEFLFFVTLGALVFSSCGVLRLVRFNVEKIHKGQDIHVQPYKQHFTGMPIPGACACMTSANLFLLQSPFWMELGSEARSVIMFFVMIFLGYLMVSRWKFPSFKTLNFTLASFELSLVTATMTAIVLYGVLHNFPLTFFCISWGYLIATVGLLVIRKLAGNKSKTLEEFEPEPDTD